MRLLRRVVPHFGQQVFGNGTKSLYNRARVFELTVPTRVKPIELKVDSSRFETCQIARCFPVCANHRGPASIDVIVAVGAPMVIEHQSRQVSASTPILRFKHGPRRSPKDAGLQHVLGYHCGTRAGCMRGREPKAGGTGARHSLFDAATPIAALP